MQKLPNLSVSPSIKAARNSIIEIILCLVIAALFYWFLLAPKLAQVSVKRAELTQIKSQRDSVESDAKALEALSKSVSSNREQIDHLDEALPLNEREIRNQMLIEELANSSGATLGSISMNNTGNSVAAGNLALLKDPFAVKRVLGVLNISMSVKGNINQLLDLIKKIENYGRIMDINSLDLSAGEKDQLDVRLSMQSYYFGPQ